MTLLLAAIWSSKADMYLNSPRGSNNKLREQSNNVQNANRLFDSQNNAASGYQIGDDCKPACKDGNNNYDVTVEGATKGTMKFYQGSELYVEWHHQHGCGVGHPNLRCQIILQYMAESDNPNVRDGTDQDSAGGDDDDPTEEETAEVARGYHEPYDFYQSCTLLTLMSFFVFQTFRILSSPHREILSLQIKTCGSIQFPFRCVGQQSC